jgi:hypothetical protein
MSTVLARQSRNGVLLHRVPLHSLFIGARNAATSGEAVTCATSAGQILLWKRSSVRNEAFARSDLVH